MIKRKEIRCDCNKRQLLGIFRTENEETEFSMRRIKYELKIERLNGNSMEIVCPECGKVHIIVIDNYNNIDILK